MSKKITMAVALCAVALFAACAKKEVAVDNGGVTTEPVSTGKL